MTSWKIYKLGDICDYVTSRTTRIENYISTENMLPNKGGVCTPSNVPSGAAIEYKVGDILISNIRPYFQKIWQADCNGACSADVLCIRANDKTDSKYLYYLLSQQRFFDYVMAGAKGCKMPRGDKKQIMQWQISLPPLEEQRRIAGILGAIDDKIENNRRINTNLELQAQALYKQWFVDFEFPNEEDKPYKSSGGKMVDSELGPIPEGWSVQTISDISVRIASGGTPKSLNESYYNGEIKWFTTKELKDCFLIDSDKHISTEALNDSAAKLFPNNTILMAIYAAPTVGRLGILTAESTFNQAAVGIVVKEEIGHLFVYLTLLAERENLNNLASGAAQQNLNVGIVKQYKLIVPTKKLLIEFNQIAGSLFERIKVVSNENKTLATLRDTLLPKLMNGEIKL